MKVILRKSVPGIGEPSQVIQVKDGFARNYLIPQGLAAPATGENIRHLENLKGMQSKRKDILLKGAQETAEKIAALTLTLAKPAGENERLFGTITPMEVAEALAGKGLEVDRRRIIIGDPIKNLGAYTIQVKLHARVSAPLKIEVVKKA